MALEEDKDYIKFKRYKEDLKESLPDWKIEDLIDVKLHGPEISLIVAKIISILHYHKITF